MQDFSKIGRYNLKTTVHLAWNYHPKPEKSQKKISFWGVEVGSVVLKKWKNIRDILFNKLHGWSLESSLKNSFKYLRTSLNTLDFPKISKNSKKNRFLVCRSCAEMCVEKYFKKLKHFFRLGRYVQKSWKNSGVFGTWRCTSVNFSDSFDQNCDQEKIKRWKKC